MEKEKLKKITTVIWKTGVVFNGSHTHESSKVFILGSFMQHATNFIYESLIWLNVTIDHARKRIFQDFSHYEVKAYYWSIISLCLFNRLAYIQENR